MTIFVQCIRKFNFRDHICNTLYFKLEIKDTKSSCWAESLTVSSTFINTQKI